MPSRLHAVCLLAAAVAVMAAAPGPAAAEAPLSVVHYSVSVAGTQESTWALAGGVDIQGSEPACQAPIEASGHMLQTFSSAKPATLDVTSSPADAVSGILKLVVATDRTGTDTVHWAAVNATGGCGRAKRVDAVHSQARCGAFAYHLPIRVSASDGALAIAGDHDWRDEVPNRFDQQFASDCPWVQVADTLVLNEFGQKDDPPAIYGGVLEASGRAPGLAKLPDGVRTLPIDADTTYTGTGGGTPWTGTMTLHVVLHLKLTLTPLGGEDNSLEPGLGIGGVHLGDALDAVRLLYPQLVVVRRLEGGRALWLIGVRGGDSGLQAIVGGAGSGAKPSGKATVREVETTFATPGSSGHSFHTSSGLGVDSPVTLIRRALHGHGLAWKRPSDGRTFNSWYVPGRGRVETEFDLGQFSFKGVYASRARGYQVRVGCPGTSRVVQYKGRPAAGAC